MAKILVAGLNPAWQQVFRLRDFRPGGVNRAEAFWSLGSGKGLNVAKNLARRGHETHLLHVLAGENGRRVRAACEAFDVRSLEAWVEGETRVCTTLLREAKDGGIFGVDEIIGPFAVDGNAGREAAGRLLTKVPVDCDALLVCGSMPPGIPESTLADIARRAAAPLVIWDSVAGLDAGILPRVSWLKVNAAELAALEPVLAKSSARPARFVTDGAQAARLTTAEASWTGFPPRLETVVNPIGAGDAATAAFADGLLRGLNPPAAASAALAAASASCLNPSPSEWDEDNARRLEQDVRWSPA